MIIRVLFLLLIIFASVWLGVQLHNDPGYVLIAINHWTVETTLLVGIAALILSFVVLHVLLNIFSSMSSLPSAFSKWRTKRLLLKAQNKTSQGLIEFSEGHWQEARKNLIKALPNSENPLLNYLTAARAAQEMGELSLRDQYLREAEQSMPETKIAVGLTKAQLQLDNQQWEQALATLRQLQDLSPNHAYVLKLLMRLYLEVADWQQLVKLLPELRRNQVMPSNRYVRLQKKAYLHCLQEYIKHGGLDDIKELVQSAPKNLHHDADWVCSYTQYLISHNEDEQAELILRRTLNKNFDERLLDVYSEIKPDKSNLRLIESFLKKHQHSAKLNLCLGRLCKSQDLWGKAKTYFEESINLGATPIAYAELAELLERLNDLAGAADAYQKGLTLAVAE